MTSANFTLDGTDYEDRGFVATAGGTVALALASATGVSAARVRLVQVSKLASVIPELDVDDPGLAIDPPSATVTLTIPNEVSSWLVEVKVNNGASARGVEPTWTRTRKIWTVGASGASKNLPTERDEGDPDNGWAGAQNDLVDAVDALMDGNSPFPPIVGNLGITSEHAADANVRHGYRVARWVDTGNARVDLERLDLAATQRGRPRFEADYGDGFPAITFADVLGPTPVGLASQLPLITSAVFSIALRVRVPAADVTVLSVSSAYPSGDPDVTRLTVHADYTSGATTLFKATLTDDDASTPIVASATATHSAWHTVIVRCDDSTLSVRIDGTNGTGVDIAPLTTFDLFDVTTLGLSVAADDGAPTGDNFTDGAIRHIVTADGRKWTDDECAAVETAINARWI